MKKKLGHFFALFSTISLIFSVFLFFIFIQQGIPLKYILGVIIVYFISHILSYIFNSGKKTDPFGDILKKSPLSLFILGNIAALVLVLMLIRKYFLYDYLVQIVMITTILINVIIIEYTFHSLSTFFRSQIGRWISRTMLLTFITGMSIFVYNIIINIPADTSFNAVIQSNNPLSVLIPEAKPQKTKSEFTGTISTIDTENMAEDTPWKDIKKTIQVNDTGIEVGKIQEFLEKEGFYTGAINNVFSPITAQAVNRYAKEVAKKEFNKLELDSKKLEILKRTTSEVTGTLSTSATSKSTDSLTPPLSISASPSINSFPLATNKSASFTGRALKPLALIPGNVNIEQKNNHEDPISIDSIESIDGNATAKIENGKIIIQVLPAKGKNSTGGIQTGTGGGESLAATPTNQLKFWNIQSGANGGSGVGGLRGIVISAPKASIESGKYEKYQSITFYSEGASGIFFTLDGSDPSCNGKDTSEITTSEKKITIKAISCFGGNKIRGPIAAFNYSIE